MSDETAEAAAPTEERAAEIAAAEKLAGAAKGRDRAIFGVPIEVTVSVGKAHPMISEIVSLRRDSVLPLESRVDDPVEIYVGSKLIARGELQELEDEGGRLGVRLTEIMDLNAGG
jgi:Flagellar motor switch/type III secretory pathway protein